MREKGRLRATVRNMRWSSIYRTSPSICVVLKHYGSPMGEGSQHESVQELPTAYRDLVFRIC